MKIKIFTIQKNEEFLIDWLNYYGDLVGYENIFFIDNESNNETLHILNKYKSKYNLKLYTIQKYYNRVSYLNKLMSKHKNTADILLALDGDEFICVKQNNDFIFNKHIILQELNKLNLQFKNKYEIYNSIPTRLKYDDAIINILQFKKYIKQPKVIFPAKYFESTDNGNHVGKISINDDIILQSNIAMLHFKLTSYKSYINKILKYHYAFLNANTHNHIYLQKHYDLLEKNQLLNWYINKIKQHKNTKNKIIINNFKTHILNLRLKY